MARQRGRSVPALPNGIGVDWFIYYNQQRYRIVECSLIKLEVVNTTTGQSETLDVASLLRPTSPSQAVPIYAPSEEALNAQIEQSRIPADAVSSVSLPAHFKAKAKEIIKSVEDVNKKVAAKQRDAFLKGSKKFSKVAAIREVCKELKISIALYYKRLRICKENNWDENRIAAAMRRSTYAQTKQSKATLHFVDTLILQFYVGNTSRMKPAMLYQMGIEYLDRIQQYWPDPNKCKGDIPEDLVYELLDTRIEPEIVFNNKEKRALLTKIKMPSTGWFYGYIHYFEADPVKGRELIDSRYGPGTWDRVFGVFDTFVQEASLPLQYVFADHYLLDVFNVDDETRSKLQRLWLTVLIDAFSRSIIGFFLSYEGPCIESIQGALLHGIWPKQSHTDLGIPGELLAYGIPLHLSLDNAWAHHSDSLENLSRAIGQDGRYTSMILIHRPRYTARLGALVERFFGNLSGKIKSLLAGAIQSSDYKDIQNAAKHACLLFGDIDTFIHRAVVNYQNSPHRELGGMTPNQKFAEGMQAIIPNVPPLTPGIERLFWRKLPDTRQISEKGISLFGLHYNSPELKRAKRVGLDGRPLEYSCHYDPSDISRLAVFLDTKHVCDVQAKELRLPGGTYRRVSLSELEMAKDLARDARQNTRDWFNYFAELRQLTETRQDEKIATQRKARKTTSKRQHPTDPHKVEQALGHDTPSNSPDFGSYLSGFARPSDES